MKKSDENEGDSFLRFLKKAIQQIFLKNTYVYMHIQAYFKKNSAVKFSSCIYILKRSREETNSVLLKDVVIGQQQIPYTNHPSFIRAGRINVLKLKQRILCKMFCSNIELKELYFLDKHYFKYLFCLSCLWNTQLKKNQFENSNILIRPFLKQSLQYSIEPMSYQSLHF